MNFFKDCIDCVPPTRYPGCGDHCEKYQKAKVKHDAYKDRQRKATRAANDLYEIRMKAAKHPPKEIRNDLT